MEGQYIEFRKTRDFSNKVNTTFEFIKQNYKALFKSILFIAGPPMLMAGLLLGTVMGDISGFQRNVMTGEGVDIFNVNFFIQLGLAFVFIFITAVTTTSAIHNFMVVYEERKGESIEVFHVWEKVKATMGSYFATAFLLAILILFLYMVMIIPMVVLAAVNPLLIFLGVLVVIFGFFYIFVNLALVFPVRAFERIGFFGAVGRSFRLIQGKWWSTFGLGMVLTLIASVVSYVFAIPYYVVYFSTTLHSLDPSAGSEPTGLTEILLTVFFCFSYLGQTILYTLPLIGIALQYFNLVEMKEARGLMSQIQTFGAPVKGATAEEGDEF